MRAMDKAQGKFSLSDCLEVERSCLALNLRRAERVISQIYDAALRPVGIKSTQFSLLVTIRAMQPSALSKIADHIDMDRTTLTRNLDVLVESRLVATTRGEDLRERVVSITEKGDAALAAALPIWRATQERLSAKAGKQPVSSLIEGLKTIAAVVA
jgi:DNA-binding MarR family transcriptional regulator